MIIGEIIKYLINIYINPNKIENAKNKYIIIIIKPFKTFSEFYTRFLKITSNIKISKSEYLNTL